MPSNYLGPSAKEQQMAVKPRGDCSVCGRSIQLKKDGTLRVHLSPPPPGRYRPANCLGSGLFPEERTEEDTDG